MNMKRIALALLVVVAVVVSPRASAAELKVLTFNTWLLEFLNIKLAPNILERRELIARELEQTDADVVNLIEVWQPKNADFLVSRLRHLFPYCSFNPDRVRAGAFYGNGLLILSRYPLKHGTKTYKNGCTRPLDELIYPETTRFDEQFVSKGAIHTVVHHPELGDVDLFSSHLGALTFKEKIDDYVEKHQQKVLAQSHELISFIERVSVTPSQLLMIDTNRHFRKWQAFHGESHELDPVYRALLSIGLHDSFMEANHLDPRELEGVYSFDLRTNPNAGDGHFSRAPSEFIDYVFFRSKLLIPQAGRMTFQHAYALNGHSYFLSDHFAVESQFGSREREVLAPLAAADEF